VHVVSGLQRKGLTGICHGAALLITTAPNLASEINTAKCLLDIISHMHCMFLNTRGTVGTLDPRRGHNDEVDMKGRHRYMVIVRPAHRPLVEAVVLALDTRLLYPSRHWSACNAMDIFASMHAAALVSAEAGNPKGRRLMSARMQLCKCWLGCRAYSVCRCVSRRVAQDSAERTGRQGRKLGPAWPGGVREGAGVTGMFIRRW